jgi:hypothetical protein
MTRKLSKKYLPTPLWQRLSREIFERQTAKAKNSQTTRSKHLTIEQGSSISHGQSLKGSALHRATSMLAPAI